MKLKLLKWIITLIFGMTILILSCVNVIKDSAITTEASITTTSNIKTKSDGVTFNTTKDFIDISINNTISSALNLTFGYEERGGVIYPYFEFTVPNTLIANFIKGRSFNIPYTLRFDRDISKDFNKGLIPLGKDYFFKPQFYLIHSKPNHQNTISGKV